MMQWLLIGSGGILVAVAIAVLAGRARDTTRARRMEAALIESASRPDNEAVDAASRTELPAPVARYFRHVLMDQRRAIKTARIRQAGVLRTSTTAGRWLPFTATQLVVPPAVGFLWNARVEMPLATHLRVRDSYIDGSGAGCVSLLSALPVASAADTPALNSGALHRYLAEAVWCPTALLPRSGVMWSPIDDHTAMATMTDRGTTVSLQFRFNDAGEVVGIYSPGRFGRFDGEYRRVPWEGHFRDYQVQGGMRVPGYGEVGWHDGGTLQLVWKGRITEVQYELEP
ncbi:hypothetical protein QLQ84_03405 [Halomonas sp. LN1S58]|uniref:Uncharacterized protein n=2 Tax=Halomonas kalidii TaxID=3043293 RepID=A0ABT6VJ90_9GAMM|nr:hypothetical protein [Halomonas kalidii]